MFRSILGIIFAIGVANASFHQKFHHHLNKHFTYDVNGFKGHQSEHGMYNVPFAPAPLPPQYGPFPHNHHHYHHHHDQHHSHGHDYHPDFPGYHNHGPQCHHNHDNGFPNMVAFNPFLVPNMPFNPMHPFNPMPPFIVPNFNPYQNNGGIPNQSIPPNEPSNQPFDPATPATPNTANNFDPSNVNIQNGGTEATTNPKSNQNNGNNLDGTGTNAFDSNNNNNNNVNTNGQATVPNVNKPEITTASEQGGKNGLMYDIDIRFGDSNDNKTKQEPSN